jgi:hypothetical protein
MVLHWTSHRWSIRRIEFLKNEATQIHQWFIIAQGAHSSQEVSHTMPLDEVNNCTGGLYESYETLSDKMCHVTQQLYLLPSGAMQHHQENGQTCAAFAVHGIPQDGPCEGYALLVQCKDPYCLPRD